MIIDTDKLLEECRLAQKATGEEYLAFQFTIAIHNRPGNYVEDIGFGSYTPGTNHTRKHKTPADALLDTVTAATEPAKLAAQAAVFEEEARKIRARIGGQP